NAQAIESIKDQHIKYQIIHLVSRLFFRGIYFPQMTKRAWIKLLAENRKTIYGLMKEGAFTWRASRKSQKASLAAEPPM
ncbi:MAG TPA: hypothetical protein VJT09_09735, partial [Pyrinomonadaceae bacterium]|nr:hypothetical protein [Pyrinomonadaceae bacterium]